MKQAQLLNSVLVAVTCTGAAAADVCHLVQDGQAKAVIVVAKDAPACVKEAAELLARLACKITGATLPIATDHAPEASKRPVVAVGRSTLTDRLGVRLDGLGPSGIAIASGPDWLVLAGPDTPDQVHRPKGPHLPLVDPVPSGTLMAVLTFVQDHWDVDWLFPDELGLVYPKRTTLTVPSGLLRRYTPPFANRKIRNIMHNTRAEKGAERIGADPKPLPAMEKQAGQWLRRQRCGVAVVMRSGHSFGDYWERYGKAHPEWFALQPDGTRDQGQGNRERLCLSNEALRAEVVRNVVTYFREHPGAASFSIGLNDGGAPVFCTCEGCRAWDVPEAGMVQWGRRTVPNMSDRVWRFTTDIARAAHKLCPGKVITAYAYSAYKDPPRRTLEFPPNLLIGIVGDTKTVEAWRGIGGRKFWRPNIFDMVGIGRNMAAAIGRDVRTAHEAGVTITDLDCNIGHWTTEAINYYVTAKLLWDPTGSPEDWVDRFCRLGFGKGAGAMRAYFARCATLDARIRALPRDQRPGRRSSGRYAAFWTDAWFDQCDRLIAQAEKAASDDGAVLQRVRRYKTALELTRFRVRYFTAQRQWKQAVAAYRAAADKKAVRPALEAARKTWTAIEAERKTLYRKHVTTWILNTCYLGFYGT